MATSVQTPKTASKEDLTEQLDALRDDVAAITKTLTNMTKAETRQIGERAAAAASDLSARGQHAVEDTANMVRGLETEAVNYARAKPVQSMAMAAGLGLLVGYLMRTR
ncbi:MAG: DUF883 C-terminal domain-containing protein [Pseudomonadota bacterium]